MADNKTDDSGGEKLGEGNRERMETEREDEQDTSRNSGSVSNSA